MLVVLCTVVQGLEVECRAAGGLSTHNESSWRNNIKRLGQKSQKAALALDVLLELQQAARSTGAWVLWVGLCHFTTAGWSSLPLELEC